MSLIKSIKDGQISEQACINMILRYRSEISSLKKEEQTLPREVFVSKMNDLNMSLEFAKLLRINYNNIKGVSHV